MMHSIIARCSALLFALAAICLLAVNPARAQSGWTLTTLAAFNGTNGNAPLCGLTLSKDGSTFYGTTQQGGAYGYGTLFSVPVTGGAVTTLHSFDSSDDGQNPYATLVLSADGSTLYGTTVSAGPDDDGTLFSIPAAGGALTTLHSFSGGNDGGGPYAGLLLIGSTLYGTTDHGGSLGGRGTLFAIPAAGGVLTTIYTVPAGGPSQAGFSVLTPSADGSTLYGISQYTGVRSFGRVFSLPVTGGAMTTLYSFTGGNDGGSPHGGLVVSGSTLYGTTIFGGASGDGVVFSLPVTGGASTTLYSFTGGNDGEYLYGGLILSGSMLYGTALGGGAYGQGTVFSLPVAGGPVTTLHSFTNGNDGGQPYASLLLVGGTLYGTAMQGGASGVGTVFSLTPLRTSTAVDSSPNPSAYTAAVTIDATIVPAVPVGEKVTFYNGATLIGTGTTSGTLGQSVATLTISTLPAGSDSITASYLGDAIYAPSTSSAVSQEVNFVSTSTGIKSVPNPINYGTSVTFTAWIRPIPSDGETVTFHDGASLIGSGVTSGGLATLTPTKPLAAGYHSITTSYPGDAIYAASTSGALSLYVDVIRPTMTLITSLSPATFGTSVLFTATLSANVPDGETVNFYEGAASKAFIGAAATLGGVATFATSALAGGKHTIWADYIGDPNNAYSWSSSCSQTVNMVPTTIRLKSTPSGTAYGGSVTFTAWIRPIPANGETVTFYDGVTSIGSGATSGGNATFTTTTLGLGGHSITAGYAGDSMYEASKSSVLLQNVDVVHPTTTLVSSPSPSTHGTAVTFTATVSPSVPDGETVNFYDGATSKALIGTGTTSGGVAKLTISTLATGSDTIWAEYVGDANDAYSWSSGLAQTVN